MRGRPGLSRDVAVAVGVPARFHELQAFRRANRGSCFGGCSFQQFSPSGAEHGVESVVAEVVGGLVPYGISSHQIDARCQVRADDATDGSYSIPSTLQRSLHLQSFEAELWL